MKEATLTQLSFAAGEAAATAAPPDPRRIPISPPDDAALLRELTPAIAQAQTVAGAIELTLREICAYAGLPIGQAWTRNGAPYLECSPSWCAVSDEYRAFRARSESLTFKLGEGLPGSAWSTGRPVWVSELGARPDLPRGPFAREVGIQAGLAVPVLAQGEIVAVLEFFMTAAKERDEQLIGLISAAAAQLGALILRRRAEDAVSETEQCFRLLIESVDDCAIFKLGASGDVATWNPGAHRICGYRPDEIVGYHVSRFYPPEAVREAMPELHLEQARANGRFEESDWRVRADGSRFWASVVITALYDRHGGLEGFSHVIRDTSAQHRVEEELDWLRAVVECSDDAIIGLAPENGIITTWNASAERLFGYTAREVVGRSIALLVPPERRDEALASLSDVVTASRVRTFEMLAPRKNGCRVDVSITASPVHSHGAVVGISAICKDLTDHKCARRHVERTLGAFLEPGVAGPILNNGAVPAAAEAEVTVLFLDVRNFTALSDGMQPQEVVDTLNRLFEIVVPVITGHGGQIDKFVGDGLLAVFAPSGVGDRHADAALCAALQIESRMARELDTGVEIGIGIHTGRVVVGTVGGGGKLDFTVIGDTVNTAARIEAATRRTGDTILFSRQTRDRLDAPQIRVLERDGVQIKGKRTPMRLFAPSVELASAA